MLVTPDTLGNFFRIYSDKWDISFQEVYHGEEKYWPLGEITFDPLLAASHSDTTSMITNAFWVASKIYSEDISNEGIKRIINPALFEAAKDTFSNLKDVDKWLPLAIPSIAHAINDGFTSSLVRSGILRPLFESNNVQSLADSHGAVLIPDTNAIVNGSLHYICRHYHAHIGYVGLPEDVEKELRSKTNDFKVVVDRILKNKRSNEGKVNTNDYADIVKFREFAQNALASLRRGILPVEYEILPIQASSLKSAGGDEEIIRTVAEYLRKRHASARVYFLTYDYNMARFCYLRNLNVIFCRQPSLQIQTPVYSVRYDYRSQQLMTVDPVDLLWELAYTFNSIQIVSQDGKRRALLQSHRYGNNYSDWLNNRMHLTILENEPTGVSIPEQNIAPGANIKVSDDHKIFEVSFITFLQGICESINQHLDITGGGLQDALHLTKNNISAYLHFGECVGAWELNENENIQHPELLSDFYENWKAKGVSFVRDRTIAAYTAFRKFYGVLQDQGQVVYNDKDLASKAGLNATAIKYLPKICELLNLGRMFSGTLVWTGNTIDGATFRRSLIEAYESLRGHREFVGIDEIVNFLYHTCHISHDTFRNLLSDLSIEEPELLKTSGSVALPSDRKNIFDVVTTPNEQDCIKRINLEDGFLIGARTVKALAINLREGIL